MSSMAVSDDHDREWQHDSKSLPVGPPQSFHLIGTSGGVSIDSLPSCDVMPNGQLPQGLSSTPGAATTLDAGVLLREVLYMCYPVYQPTAQQLPLSWATMTVQREAAYQFMQYQKLMHHKLGSLCQQLHHKLGPLCQQHSTIGSIMFQWQQMPLFWKFDGAEAINIPIYALPEGAAPLGATLQMYKHPHHYLCPVVLPSRRSRCRCSAS